MMESTAKRAEVCDHGNLERQCHVCELQAENEELRDLLATAWQRHREECAQVCDGIAMSHLNAKKCATAIRNMPDKEG